jgi:hypothetical protein
MGRFEALLLTASFASLLALVPSAIVVDPESAIVPHEQRVRASRPQLDDVFRSPAEFPREMDAYLRDHVGWRYRFVQLHHWIKFGWLGESPSDALLVGRDGWLFLADDYGLESYRAEDPFDADELDAWAALLGDAENWLADLDATLVVVLAPGKPSIYESHLPDPIRRAPRRTRADAWVEHLREDVHLVDLRTPLLEAAKERRVYHQLDTHWNGDGAVVAYRAVLAELRALGVERIDAPALEHIREEKTGDLSRMLHPGASPTELQVAVRPQSARAVPASFADSSRAGEPSARHTPQAFEIANASLPTAVIFRDSFGTALVPLLSENFRRSVWHWSRVLDPERIEAERPDVVILEIAERYLMASVPENRIRARLAAVGR